MGKKPKTMYNGFADKTHAALCAFFKTSQNFKAKNNQKQLVFMMDFPKKSLRIVVTTPYVFARPDDIARTKDGLHIGFAVWSFKKKCLVLRDSRMTKDWEVVAKRKIDALVSMIEDIPRCPRCGYFHLRPVQREEAQANPKGTSFVQYECPENGNLINSTFGAGIKSELHRFLVKNKR